MHECVNRVTSQLVVIVNMPQLKVFYNVPSPEGERCEVIFTDQNIQSFEELMKVVRGKIEFSFFTHPTMLRALGVNRSVPLVACDSATYEHGETWFLLRTWLFQ